MRGLKRQTGGADGRSNAVGSRRKAEGAEMRGLKRQTGGADGRSNAVGCRRNAEGAEMRGLKRQIGGADGRSNAVGCRRNALETETRRAELYGRWRAAVSRRQLAAPAPLLSIINLARAIFPTAGTFSLCSPPRSLQWHNSSPARPLTAARIRPLTPATSTPCAPSSQPLYRVLAPFAHSCGTQPHHEGVYSSARKVNGQTSKRVNK